MVAFGESVWPPLKYWSAENVVPVELVQAPPPALIRTVLSCGEPVPVVKLQPTEPASGVPSLALMVAARFAVYVVDVESCAVGVSVAFRVPESKVTFAGTGFPAGFFSVKLDLVIVLASIARENVAVTAVDVLAPVLP